MACAVSHLVDEIDRRGNESTFSRVKDHMECHPPTGPRASTSAVRADRDSVALMNHKSTTARCPERGAHVHVLGLNGTLRAPVTTDLRLTVEACIRRGARNLLLDLNGLKDIDAAGIGELVRVFAALRGVGGTMRIADAHGYVGHMLRIGRLFDLLTTGVEARLPDGGAGVRLHAR